VNTREPPTGSTRWRATNPKPDAGHPRHHPADHWRRAGKHIATVLGLQRYPGLEVNLVAGPTTGPEGSLESAFAASRNC
jgi:hypothetical protein